jgi:propionyl-CoA synthetase
MRRSTWPLTSRTGWSYCSATRPWPTLGDRDLDWDELVAGAGPVDPVPVAATDPLYILYTSGTTGKPKGVVRDNGGHAVALAWSMAAIYDIGPGDVWWTASDVGWVVGHSYIVYAPLLVGATTVLYEGKPVGTPDAGAFWRVIAEHRVKALFTAPTALRAIKKEDPEAAELVGYDLSSFRTLFLAGERLDPETYHWAHDRLGVPVVDHWWQTETGWPIAANPRGLEPLAVKPGSATVPVPGWDVQVLDELGAPLPAGQEGAIAIKLPLPPGALPTLWGDDQRYVDSYLSRYDGYYLTGDSGHLDADGYLFVMGRTDDVINVAGHRLSTGSMEAVLAAHPAVAECAVIGVHDALKGQLPRGFVVLKAGGRHLHRRTARRTGRRGTPRHRPGGRVPRGVGRGGPAEDEVGEDPAQDDAGDRRRPRRAGALHHRGPGRARRAPPDAASRAAGQLARGPAATRSRGRSGAHGRRERAR